MYNVFQFASRREQHEREAKRQRELQEYHLKHEQYKRLAYDNLKKKSEDFIARELSQTNLTVIQDDHFRSWRNHRMFRDVQDPNKFIDNKAFKHRTNQDMCSLYSERERKEISYLNSKKEDLVKSGLIPKEHLTRSMASQGPYQPKIQFRTTKKEDQLLQPRMRYANVTEEQRLNESDMCFDERLRSIYHKFQQKKLKSGRQTRFSIYCLPSQKSYASSGDMKTTKSISLSKNSTREVIQPESEGGATAISSSRLIGQPRKKSKTYFKLAQMMEMFHPELQRRGELSEFLKKSQYCRKKDLTNIRSNSFNENYQKSPIL